MVAWATKIGTMFQLRQMRGQGMVEYALILVLISIVVVAVLALLGATLGNAFAKVVSCFPPTAPGCL